MAVFLQSIKLKRIIYVDIKIKNSEFRNYKKDDGKTIGSS